MKPLNFMIERNRAFDLIKKVATADDNHTKRIRND